MSCIDADISHGALTASVYPIQLCMLLIVTGNGFCISFSLPTKIVSEYDQEKPQSQTAHNPMAPRGRTTQPSRDTRKTNDAKQPAELRIIYLYILHYACNFTNEILLKPNEPVLTLMNIYSGD